MVSLRWLSFGWSLALVPLILLSPAAAGAGLQYSMDDGESFAIERRPKDPGTTGRPVVVLLHGVDGLGEFSGSQILAFADELAQAGYVVFVPTYFGVKDGQVGGIPDRKDIDSRIGRVDQYASRIAKAVEVACAQPDADAGRVALVGFSLGGGLALQRAEASTGEIKAVVDFFGYIGNRAIYQEDAKLPPTLVFHNPEGKVVDPDYSARRPGRARQDLRGTPRLFPRRRQLPGEIPSVQARGRSRQKVASPDE